VQTLTCPEKAAPMRAVFPSVSDWLTTEDNDDDFLQSCSSIYFFIFSMSPSIDNWSRGGGDCGGGGGSDGEVVNIGRY